MKNKMCCLRKCALWFLASRGRRSVYYIPSLLPSFPISRGVASAGTGVCVTDHRLLESDGGG